MVVPWVALGLGDALLGTSNGASSHAQDRLLGSPLAGVQPCPSKPCPRGGHAQDQSVEPGVCSPAQFSRGDCPHQHLSCPGGCSPGGIWGASLSPSGACSLVCAHRHPGRMAWHSLVLLPFLLATGKDSSWHLNGRVGGVGAAFNPQYSFSILWGKLQPKTSCLPHRRARARQGWTVGEARGLQLEEKCGLEVWDEHKDEGAGGSPASHGDQNHVWELGLELRRCCQMWVCQQSLAQ